MRRAERDEASDVSDAALSADESSVVPDDESEVEPSSRSSKPGARPPVLTRREQSSPYSLTTVVLIVALLVAIAWGIFTNDRTLNCDPRLSRDALPATLQAFLNQSTNVPLAFSISCPCFASAISCGTVPIVFPSAGDTFATLLQRAQAKRGHVLIGGISGKTHAEWFDISLKQCIDPTVAFSHAISCSKFAFLLENVPDGYYPSLIAEATVHYH